MEKASEAEKHENGLLRAQVERLQTELREYRKRLSLNSGRTSGSPPVGGYASVLANLANQASNNSGNNNFQFDFPRFGGLPGAHIFNNGALGKQNGAAPNAAAKPGSQSSTPAAPNRNNSIGRSVSPKSGVTSIAQSPEKQVNNPLAAFGMTVDPSTGLYTNPLFGASAAAQNVQRERSSTGTSSTQSRIFQFNSGSTPSNSGSPSASSNSQFGGNANSSCGTSPEPSHNSPSNKADANPDTLNAEKGYVCYGNSEGEVQFCEMLNMACGNPRNPIPRTKSSSDGKPAPTSTPAAASGDATTTAAAATTSTPAAGPTADKTNGIDTMATQNGGQFDPSLFGDYRDSTAAIVGDGDFTGGFFDAAFPMPDLGSPFNAIQTPALQKSNPLEEIERLQDGGGDEDEIVPGDDMSKMLNCHKIWYGSPRPLRNQVNGHANFDLYRDTLQQNPEFKEGSFDIDGLCSELRAKARCSESGVVVDQKDVDAALKRMPRPGSQPA
ncbi:MAG: hypothetical protein INR71_00950 [Terriglobus roseus]|nr:hypothetical protein [Terriglobus roseus]